MQVAYCNKNDLQRDGQREGHNSTENFKINTLANNFTIPMASHVSFLVIKCKDVDKTKYDNQILFQWNLTY